MNSYQMALQIRHELRNVVWPDGSGDEVFGTRGAHAFAGLPTEEQIPPGFPWCLVTVDSADHDEDDPELIQQQYTVLTAAEVSGDPLGDFSILGGSVADLGKSVGRGALEVAERVRSAVQDLTGIDGAQIQLSASTQAPIAQMGRGRHISLVSQNLSAWCTSALHYTAPQDIAVTGSTWTWTGGQCSDRFDFLQYRLVSKSGTSASTDPSDGTVVYTGTAATASVAVSSGNTYTVFADYNSRGGSTVDDSSEPEVGSYHVEP